MASRTFPAGGTGSRAGPNYGGAEEGRGSVVVGRAGQRSVRHFALLGDGLYFLEGASRAQAGYSEGTGTDRLNSYFAVIPGP